MEPKSVTKPPAIPADAALPAERSSDGLAPASASTAAEAPRQGYANRGAAGYASADEALQQTVLAKLIEHPGFDADSLGVRVKEAVVTLEGTVASSADRAIAVNIAKAVAGVAQVRDRLSVRSGVFGPQR